LAPIDGQQIRDLVAGQPGQEKVDDCCSSTVRA
jgi:hypothetical protein